MLRTMRVGWTFGQQRLASGTWALEGGPFYGGTRRTFSYSSARIKLNPAQVSFVDQLVRLLSRSADGITTNQVP